jgi:hypothetical protein
LRTQLIRGLIAAVGVAALAVIAAGPTAADGGSGGGPGISRGPSTTTDPYVLPVASGVRITSLLTVSDAGAASNGFELGGGSFTLYNNQEIGATLGSVRSHGQMGGFVS